MIAWRPEFAAGILLRAKSTGRYLLLQNAETRLWETPGGHVERGESSEDAAIREFREETGGALKSYALCRGSVTVDGYRLFFGESAREFRPRLSAEHVAHRWVSADDLPQPLHPGLVTVLCAR